MWVASGANAWCSIVLRQMHEMSHPVPVCICICSLHTDNRKVGLVQENLHAQYVKVRQGRVTGLNLVACLAH